jgi:hypothetical protein
MSPYSSMVHCRSRALKRKRAIFSGLFFIFWTSAPGGEHRPLDGGEHRPLGVTFDPLGWTLTPGGERRPLGVSFDPLGWTLTPEAVIPEGELWFLRETLTPERWMFTLPNTTRGKHTLCGKMEGQKAGLHSKGTTSIHLGKTVTSRGDVYP